MTVRTACFDDRVEVSVHNHGTPIPEALLPHLFEPMVRGAEAGARAKGVGLGLYIVREIARAHGGTVRVESRAGDGTTFTLSLPTV